MEGAGLKNTLEQKSFSGRSGSDLKIGRERAVHFLRKILSGSTEEYFFNVKRVLALFRQC